MPQFRHLDIKKLIGNWDLVIGHFCYSNQERYSGVNIGLDSSPFARHY
jgi:hypothetical protein